MRSGNDIIDYIKISPYHEISFEISLKIFCHLKFITNHKNLSSVTSISCIVRDLKSPRFQFHIRVTTSKFHDDLDADNPNLSPFSRQKFIIFTAYDQ